MKLLRNVRTGRSRPVRIVSATGAAAALLAAAAPLPMPAFAANAQSAAIAQAAAAASVTDFYAARGNRPLWLEGEGRQAELLLALFDSARVDGLDPAKYRSKGLDKALRAAWGGNPKAALKADRMLSEAFVAFVRDLRRPAETGTFYVDPELRPRSPSPAAILGAAAKAASLEDYVRRMGWMHPLYAELRKAVTSGQLAGGAQRERAILNLERVRELPGPGERHILVNAAAQRLFLYEDGKVTDSMRVVVGKPIYPTPTMAALIRYTALNPYWYVPPDLAAERIAPGVVKEGLRYLKVRGYQVVDDFVENPRIIDPATIDWQAVADGRSRVLIRQLPGPGNSMGRMKFMFPNSEGIYLHDTPEKELLEEASRLFSGGCVRLEDAPRVARWLYGKAFDTKSAKPEQKVALEKPVPVYITYLTAVPDGSRLTFFEDIYGRDAQRLARKAGSRAATASR